MTQMAYFDSLSSVSQYGDYFLRLILACICGAAIGFERAKRFKEAGMRTHIIVCCTAALIMVVSKYGFADLTLPDGSIYNGTRGADPARIAAQVVSGISFLCAGVIFKNGNTVKGLTTAAGLWGTACIGLAIGSGMWALGIFTTLIISVLQVVMHKYTVGADSYINTRLRFTVRNDESFMEDFDAQLCNWDAQMTDCQIVRAGEGLFEYDIVLKSRREIGIKDLKTIMDSDKRVEKMAVVSVS